MIPASYLFKDIYQREWLDPEVEMDVAAARQRTGTPRHTFSALIGFLGRFSAPRHRASGHWSHTPAE